MVFVHGLGGDAFSTWRHGKDNSTSWPHWLGEEFPDVGIWSLGYAASATKWIRVLGWFSKRWRESGHGMALPDRALQVLDLMVQRGIGQRPLLFICHSLGGLVAKQILRASSDAVSAPSMQAVFGNTRAVLFLATPHGGAELATRLAAFRIVFGATVTIQDLRAHDPHLANLLDWYRKHASPERIQTATYFELRGVKGVTIVNRTTSHPGVGADPVGLDEDHLSIAKPRERDAQVCGAARDLLRNCVLAIRQSSESTRGASPLPPGPSSRTIIVNLDGAPRIPRELPPAADEFLGRKAELERLIERLRARRNTAIVGPAGFGKTALAAEGVRAVLGETDADLARSSFPDGIVFLDLYSFHGLAEAAWNRLANTLAGAGLMEHSPARDRATEACRSRDLLVILEGGEEADGRDGRAAIRDILSVLSPQNRWLLLTRLSTQATPQESVELKHALEPEDAARLFDSLTKGRVTTADRDRVLALLEGHPLALTWAGNLLARDDEDPGRLVADWTAKDLPKLSDPRAAERTLEWLFTRSARGLGATSRLVLAAAGLLARAPFPLAAIEAAVGNGDDPADELPRDALRTMVQRGLLRRAEDFWDFTHVLGYRFARQETGSDPALRERMGRWLRAELAATLAANDAGDGSLRLTRGLEHLDALLRADDDQSLWAVASYALYEALDRLLELGRLPQAKAALGAIAHWIDRVPPGSAEDPFWRRERSVLLNRQGDVLRDQGDLGGALAAYLESLAVRRRLAEVDPSNAGWQRDLSVSQDRVGNVLRDQGDLGGALAAYLESLAVSGRLAEADPSNAGWQRDLSVSQDRVGDVLRDQGLGGALAAYLESLAVSRRLAEVDPSNAGWQRDLSFSLTRMAEFHERQGDTTQALLLSEESLMIDERLAALDPSNATWQGDVLVSRSLVARLRR